MFLKIKQKKKKRDVENTKDKGLSMRENGLGTLPGG